MEAWDVILSEKEQAFILVWDGITGIWEPDAGVDLEPHEPEQQQ